MERLLKRGVELARQGAREVLDAGEAAMREFPDVEVERQGDTLVLRGRGLLRRWLSDARFRFGSRGYR